MCIVSVGYLSGTLFAVAGSWKLEFISVLLLTMKLPLRLSGRTGDTNVAVYGRVSDSNVDLKTKNTHFRVLFRGAKSESFVRVQNPTKVSEVRDC